MAPETNPGAFMRLFPGAGKGIRRDSGFGFAGDHPGRSRGAWRRRADRVKPRRGDLFIAPARPSLSFFLFFSGAALARLQNPPPAAPLKNKKNGGWSRSSINRSPPRGFLALGAPGIAKKQLEHSGWSSCPLASTFAKASAFARSYGGQDGGQAVAQSLGQPRRGRVCLASGWLAGLGSWTGGDAV